MEVGQQKFMLDIETAGLEFKKSGARLLEIGVLEMVFNGDHFRPGRSFTRVLPSSARASEWAVANGQQELYTEANRLFAEVEDAGSYFEQARQDFTAFFRECGITKPEDLHLAGRNLAGFDLPWLYFFDFLAKEDHHYRLYDVTPALLLFADAQYLIKEVAEAVCLAHAKPGTPSSTYDAAAHTALGDCYRQVEVVNGLLTIMRSGVNAAIKKKALADL
jgi:hypothetical protein